MDRDKVRKKRERLPGRVIKRKNAGKRDRYEKSLYVKKTKEKNIKVLQIYYERRVKDMAGKKKR